MRFSKPVFFHLEICTNKLLKWHFSIELRMSTVYLSSTECQREWNQNNWIEWLLLSNHRNQTGKSKFFLSKPDENVFSSQHCRNGKGHRKSKTIYTARTSALWENQIFIFIGKCHDCAPSFASICIAWSKEIATIVFHIQVKWKSIDRMCAMRIPRRMYIPNRKKTGRAYEYSVKQVSHTANQINGLCAASIQLKVQLTFTCRFYAQKP